MIKNTSQAVFEHVQNPENNLKYFLRLKGHGSSVMYRKNLVNTSNHLNYVRNRLISKGPVPLNRTIATPET